MTGGDTAAVYDAALHRREALMGASGPMALVKNARVFAIASFACIGGVLYGYNQGMFSGVLAMPSFQQRIYPPFFCSSHHTSSTFMMNRLTPIRLRYG